MAEWAVEPWSLTPKPTSEPPRLMVVAGGNRDPEGPGYRGEMMGRGSWSGGHLAP